MEQARANLISARANLEKAEAALKSFVIDNSVVMAWYFEDEASDYTVAVLAHMA